MIKKALRSALIGLIVVMLLVLAPAYLVVIGQGIALVGRLIGIVSIASPTLFAGVSGLIGFLWGLRSFLTSKS